MSFLRRRLSRGGTGFTTFSLTVGGSGVSPVFDTCEGPTWGYIPAFIGSLSPSTYRGMTINNMSTNDLYFANYVTSSCDYVGTNFDFFLGGFGSDPGISFFNRIVIPTSTTPATYNSSSASYSYGGGTAVWTWSTGGTAAASAIASGTVTIYN